MTTISTESAFFQTCQLCDKIFTQEHPYKRHVNYCRRAQTQRKGRPKSCTSCRTAKAKCTFGQPCSRCLKKGVRCVYPCSGVSSIGQSHQVDDDLQALDCFTTPESDQVSFDFNDLLVDTISPMTTDATTNYLDMSWFNISSDMQINMPMQSLSAKGDLTRVSTRLSSLQYASRVIMQMLYAFPQMMLRRQTFPPFIHPHWHQKHLPETLGNCMSIARLFAARTAETESFLWKMISAEEERFRDKLYTCSPYQVHLCLQAMIVYMIMAMGDNKDCVSRLFETTELIGSRFLDLEGSYSTTESSIVWEDWIFAESRRRMSCLWLIISCVITIENGHSGSGCHALHDLPLPSSKMLWEAKTLEEWQTEKAFYDVSPPLKTVGELVGAKGNVGDIVEKNKLLAWEMGSDKMAAMLDIAVEFVWGRTL
ncbi:hypothetical protein LB507_010310 [Fusarium sp. FIESC RH6]|nr:hypothetical protein LB507_010310 [Fusarium sp. FIESC RH6]